MSKNLSKKDCGKLHFKTTENTNVDPVDYLKDVEFPREILQIVNMIIEDSIDMMMSDQKDNVPYCKASAPMMATILDEWDYKGSIDDTNAFNQALNELPTTAICMTSEGLQYALPYTDTEKMKEIKPEMEEEEIRDKLGEALRAVYLGHVEDCCFIGDAANACGLYIPFDGKYEAPEIGYQFLKDILGK